MCALGGGGFQAFSMLYAQECLGMRRDVAVVNLYHLTFPWYTDAVRAVAAVNQTAVNQTAAAAGAGGDDGAASGAASGWAGLVVPKGRAWRPRKGKGGGSKGFTLKQFLDANAEGGGGRRRRSGGGGRRRMFVDPSSLQLEVWAACSGSAGPCLGVLQEGSCGQLGGEGRG